MNRLNKIKNLITLFFIIQKKIISLDLLMKELSKKLKFIYFFAHTFKLVCFEIGNLKMYFNSTEIVNNLINKYIFNYFLIIF